MIEMRRKLVEEIDAHNDKFISEMKNKLQDLSIFSERYLDWLMLEHYQFSYRNTKLLAIAAEETSKLADLGVAQELWRNYEEEKNHASIYKKALKEIGSDVEQRKEFNSTTLFLNSIESLITINPSKTLGVMYATETAALFEHEVFREISCEVVKRRQLKWNHSRLKLFHDMHLNGVEQSHKDGLGIFLDRNDILDTQEVWQGALDAIETMHIWWIAMLNHALTQKEYRV